MSDVLDLILTLFALNTVCVYKLEAIYYFYSYCSNRRERERNRQVECEACTDCYSATIPHYWMCFTFKLFPMVSWFIIIAVKRGVFYLLLQPQHLCPVCCANPTQFTFRLFFAFRQFALSLVETTFLCSPCSHQYELDSLKIDFFFNHHSILPMMALWKLCVDCFNQLFTQTNETHKKVSLWCFARQFLLGWKKRVINRERRDT